VALAIYAHEIDGLVISIQSILEKRTIDKFNTYKKQGLEQLSVRR